MTMDQLPGGSWAQSCLANAAMKGSVLTATCRAINGDLVPSFLNLNKCKKPVTVGNANGHLVCESGGGIPPGSWQRSCKSPSIKDNVLSALCGDVQGVFRSSEIDLRTCSGTISNLDGALTCD